MENDLKSKYSMNDGGKYSIDWEGVNRDSGELIRNFPFIKDPEFLKLTPTQQRVVVGYMLKDLRGFNVQSLYRYACQRPEMTDGNAAAAYMSCKRSPRVRKFIEKLDWLRVEELGFTAQRIIEEELAISYSDITDYLDEDGLIPVANLKNLPPLVRRAIKSVEVVVMENGDRKYKLTLWDKGQSLHRIQKVKGMHQDNVNLTGGLSVLNIGADMDPKEASQLYLQMLKGPEGSSETGETDDNDGEYTE